MTDWREAYRSLDSAGSSESCGDVAWCWIEAEAQHATEYVHPMRLLIEVNGVSDQSCSIVLYLDRQPYAVATVFRDSLNRSVLIRWKAP